MMGLNNRRLGACALLAAGLLPWAGPSQGQEADARYPAALDRATLVEWLRRETDIAADQVIAISPSAITSLVSTYPILNPPGVHASVRAEALTPNASSRAGVLSWQTGMDVDCRGRRIRVGATTGYTTRNLLGQPLPVTPGDGDWRAPTAGTQLESIWRAVCEPSRPRPLAAGQVSIAAQADTATSPPPAPERRSLSPPVPPAVASPPPQLRPALPVRPPPAAVGAPRRQMADVAVQVIGSASQAEAQRAAAAAAARGAPSGPLSASVAKVEVGGRTVYRGLVKGFASRVEAASWCARLKTSGQACFLR